MKIIFIIYVVLITLGTYYVVGWVLESKGPDQLEEFRQQTRKKNVNQQINKGKGLLSSGKKLKGIELLEALLLKHPYDYDTRLIVANTHLQLCRVNQGESCDLALWHYNFLIENFPDNSKAYGVRAQLNFILLDSVSGKLDLMNFELLQE